MVIELTNDVCQSQTKSNLTPKPHMRTTWPAILLPTSQILRKNQVSVIMAGKSERMSLKTCTCSEVVCEMGETAFTLHTIWHPKCLQTIKYPERHGVGLDKWKIFLHCIWKTQHHKNVIFSRLYEFNIILIKYIWRFSPELDKLSWLQMLFEKNTNNLEYPGKH